MLRLAAAVLFLSPLAASADSFDSGIDARAAFLGAKSGGRELAGVRDRDVPRECRVIVAEPGGPLATSPVWLEEGEPRDPHYYDGVYTGTPRSGGYSSYPRRERVQLELVGPRQTLPWERETFEACLAGGKVYVRPLKTAYDYDVNEDPREPGNFILIAGKKLAMAPDPDGIEATLANGQGRLTVWFADKWPSYYRGEPVAVHVELWRERRGWLDSKVSELETSIAGPDVGISFAGTPGVQAGEAYYAKWSFRRLGQVSKDTKIEGRKTASLIFLP